MKTIQFGKPTPGIEYKDRLGVYALILREDGLICAVESDKDKVFGLPGGGVDVGETDEEALRREVREEIVREIESFSFAGEARQYRDHTEKESVNKICKYFIVKLTLGADGKGDRITRWLTLDEFKSKARGEADVWAIKTFLLSTVA